MNYREQVHLCTSVAQRLRDTNGISQMQTAIALGALLDELFGPQTDHGTAVNQERFEAASCVADVTFNGKGAWEAIRHLPTEWVAP